MQITTAARRVYMSILSILLVFVTTIATTFAWVGILNYTELGSFDVNLGVGEVNDAYRLSICTTPDGEFSDTANSTDIKRQILNNMGILTGGDNSDEFVEKQFKSVTLNSVTTSNLKDFQTFLHKEKRFEDSLSYFKFDLYLKIERKNNNGSNKVEDDINFNTGLMFNTDVNPLQGVKCSSSIVNGMTYPSNGIYDHPGFDITNENSYVTIDSSYATRFALEIYSPKNSGESFDNNPIATKIYYNGSYLPTYDKTTKLYSFGGILPEEYNIAYQEYKSIYRPGKDFVIPDDILNRGDLEINEKNSMLLAEESGFGINSGISNILKVTVYFWYEGWDADCFEAIAGKSVSLNLVFKA